MRVTTKLVDRTGAVGCEKVAEEVEPVKAGRSHDVLLVHLVELLNDVSVFGIITFFPPLINVIIKQSNGAFFLVNNI
jgi:hypothetical protein